MGAEERVFSVTYGELIEMVGTQNDDRELMASAIKEFKKKAKKKFVNGIMEHNPKGDKGMCMMSMKDRIRCAKEEVIDLWFYLHSLEDGIDK
tara:strand:- start:264 stop:539 length:276 start_codon:yes stop_codon:yes gene_type:complete